MNIDDDGTPMNNRQPDEPDLGPEPDWLLDDDVIEPEAEPASSQKASRPNSPPELKPGPVEKKAKPESEPSPPADPPTSEIEPLAQPEPAPVPTGPQPAAPATTARSHPWLWGAIPLVLLLATGIIAWFATTQTLNGLATWDAIRSHNPPLLPARWAMTVWWLVLPLMAVFLIYGTLPAGRAITRIKVTGPLVSVALAATSMWVFAQHWDWDVLSIASIGIAAVAILISYLLVVMGPHIRKIRQRMIAVIPLSAALGYSVMLTVVAWQSYSSQPFGERGSSVLFTLILVMIAAVLAFFLRDGLFSLILAIWFAGVLHQQWGDDAVISLVSAVALLFTAALAALGTILATESHRPSLTTSVDSGRGRTSFFRKRNSSPEELP